MKKIVLGFFSKYAIEANPLPSNVALVSITDTGSPKVQVAGIQESHILRLSFLDIEPKDLPVDPSNMLFNESKAKSILGFVQQMAANKDIDGIAVHCTMGVSRSAATCVAISSFLQSEGFDVQFEQKEQTQYANRYVLKVFGDLINKSLENECVSVQCLDQLVVPITEPKKVFRKNR